MTGKGFRLARLFGDDGRAVVIALDHAQFRGSLPGLTPISQIVGQAVAGGADGVILNPGAVRGCSDALAGRCALILRVTGASTVCNPAFDFHRQICSVEQAIALGADAVIAMGFIGGQGEADSLQLLAEISEGCVRWGMPLVAEMLPADPERLADAERIALGARVGGELGADIIKAYTTGTPVDADAIAGCGVPFLAAGGPKSEDARGIAALAMKHGAAGVAFGRNVFEAGDPRQVVEELVREVHGVGSEGGSVT